LQNQPRTADLGERGQHKQYNRSQHRHCPTRRKLFPPNLCGPPLPAAQGCRERELQGPVAAS
jgi:hypothetical protein